MIANYWTLAVITILYLCWCEVRADQKSNKLNKLEFWKRETISNETRRQQKKQTRNEKYPRTFQAVEDVNEPNQILSYDEVHTGEITKNKDENQHEKRSLLSASNENNPSSLIVWQNYVKEDKFKNKKENSLKYTPPLKAAIDQNKPRQPFLRWSHKIPSIQDKRGRTKAQGGYAIYDMFNKNYLIRNRLKDRNKIVLRT